MRYRPANDQAWIEYFRHEARQGFVELDRGESINGTPTEIIKIIRKEVNGHKKWRSA